MDACPVNINLASLTLSPSGVAKDLKVYSISISQDWTNTTSLVPLNLSGPTFRNSASPSTQAIKEGLQ